MSRFTLDRIEHPIVQAPMGGGPSTPALAAAVCEAGALGFLAAGCKTVDGARADIEAPRELTRRPFGVNLFAPPSGEPDPAEVQRSAAALAAEAERYGAALGQPRRDDTPPAGYRTGAPSRPSSPPARPRPSSAPRSCCARRRGRRRRTGRRSP